MASVIYKYSIDSDTGAMTDFIIEDVTEIPGALETICNMYPYTFESKKPEGFVPDPNLYAIVIKKNIRIPGAKRKILYTKFCTNAGII